MRVPSSGGGQAVTSPMPSAMSSPLAIRTLLIEDDDGDAFLVQELLAEAATPIQIVRVSTLAQAREHVNSVDCVLLDLGLPDTMGLSGVHELREAAPHVAILVLTGLADEHRGVEAVTAGAQDYLVKGQVDGSLLARAIRYAIERRRADESLRQLYESERLAAENARLERGLLPRPIVRDRRLAVVNRYRPGRRRSLLGGDFYDVLETDDGTLHVLIGDVAGHGPDEAALGVCLRIAWRSLILAGIPENDILPTMDDVLVRERSSEEDFATVCMISIEPQRKMARLHLAGHPAPLVVDSRPAQLPDDLVGPALGIVPGVLWGSLEVPLPELGWQLLLFTDGIIEGLVAGGPERLGVDGLTAILPELLDAHDDAGKMTDALIDTVEAIHGGDLPDDVALVLISMDPSRAGEPPVASEDW